MNIRRRHGRRAALAIAALLLVGACGGDDSDGASETTVAAGDTSAPATTGADDTLGAATTDAASDEQACSADTPKGDLSMATFVAPKGLDPQTAATSGRTGAIELAAIFDTLMRYDPDSGSFTPQVAQALEPSADASTWTLTLRDGITFGSGNALDAAAVEASISRHLDDNALNGSLAQTIASMATPDDHTVVFTLTDAWSGFPFVLAGPIGMITDPAVVAERGDDFQSNPAGAGVGPFELERYAPGEELVLRGKADYWDGPVCVDHLRFSTITDPTTAYEAFQKGEVDVAFIQDPLIVAQATSAGAESFGFKYGLGRSVVINTGARGTTPPTADVRLRQAIAMAIDPTLIDERVNQGNGDPTSAIFSEGMHSWSGVDGPAYDPDAARALVDEVKGEGQWDGTIRLVCPQLSEEAGIVIEALLKDVGFAVTRETVDTSTLVERVITNVDYDLACWQFNISDFAPWVSLEAFRSDSSSNRGGYANPEMDAAISELKVASTDAERTAALGTIQHIWNDTAPTANYGTNQDTILWDDAVSGLGFSSESLVTFGDAVVG